MKYSIYEVIESDKECNKIKIIGIMNEQKFKRLYGNREILSTKDYEDTKTTSVIIWNGVD